MGELVQMPGLQEHWERHLESSLKGVEIARHNLALLQSIGQLTLEPIKTNEGIVHRDSIARDGEW